MSTNRTPIRRALMGIILLTSGTAMLTTSGAFCAFEYISYRQQALHNLATLGEAIAANSTAALAFANADDAAEVLSALKAEPHIVEASLYTRGGGLFASYPATVARSAGGGAFRDGYQFRDGYLIGVQPVVQGTRRMGTLYLKEDLGAIYDSIRSFALIAFLVMGVSWLIAYLISTRLQRQISLPILALARTASAISEKRDYTVRAPPSPGYELGLLTDSFNHMLEQVEGAQEKLSSQLGRLDLLHRITRAIGERQDPPSIFQVVLGSLEQEMPIEFGCICLFDAALDATGLRVVTIGARSLERAPVLEIESQQRIGIDRNGLARCVNGELVYEPDVHSIAFDFPQRFARAGLLSLVLAPLLAERRVFGVLIVARPAPEAFSSAECEFLRQLSGHVALASNQAQLHGALQQAYDDLRQSQQTVLQQERLRALGQMASGIAHDINNAISPIALYTESLLEREPGLSERTRSYLLTMQLAIEDVAETVARMREFYRSREPELLLSRVSLNRLVEQVVELTRARWSDLPLQKGIVIRLQTELAGDLADIMGSEPEIRDALTNLVFNAVDAMPEGGTLTLRTACRLVTFRPGDEPVAYAHAEVVDTGLGMDEETRRRCLEPFYTTKGDRGTGLGLAMVYGMVQRHSAELEIESQPGSGTTVRLSFAVAQTSVSAPESHALIGPSVPLRILVVDDDPLLFKLLREVLTQEGHDITVADGGQKGIDVFMAAIRSPSPFSLVITDLGMPYVDGRKVAAAVKAASPETPVVMLTGWGRRLLADNDIPAHVDRVLSKPPKLAELRSALAELTNPTTERVASEAS